MGGVGVSVGESTALAPKVAWPAAVLTMSVPALRSVWVTEYERVQVTVSPGSKSASRLPTVLTAGHVTVATLSSVSVTGPRRPTLPRLLTTDLYSTGPVELTVTDSA